LCARVEGPLAAFCVLLAPAAAFAQAAATLDRPQSAGVLLPPLSIATDAAPYAASLNPAAPFFAPTALQWLHVEGESALPAARRADGVFLHLGGLQAGDTGGAAIDGALEWVRPTGGNCTAAAPCARRLSLGLAAGSPAFAAGFAWRSFASAESRALDTLTTWDAGITVRPSRRVSLALTGADLNAPAVGPSSLPRRWTLAAGVRPFSRLTLAVDATMDEDDWFDRTRVSGLVSATPWPGLDLVAQLAHDPKGSGTLALALGIRAGFGNADLDVLGAGRPQEGRSGVAAGFGVNLHGAQGPALFGRPSAAGTVRLARALDDGGLLRLVLGSGGALDPYTKLVLNLRRAAADPSLRVVVLEVNGGEGLGLARIAELRALLEDVRKAGRKVVVWLGGGGDAEYLLASGADRIFLAPQGLFHVDGLRSERIYLRGLLDKVGVAPEFEKVGEYKSAPEQFTRTQASDAAAAEYNALLDDEWQRWVAQTSAARHVSPERVQALVAEGMAASERLVELGFADGTSLPGKALEKRVEELAGARLPRRAVRAEPEVSRTWGNPAAIALVVVKGTITGGEGSAVDGSAGAETIVRRVRAAQEDPAVRAIVVRVESPGGDVTAAEAIWHAVSEAKRKKPVVASLGDVAASGGYYVAVAADEIYAGASTLTGSIGVFAGKADVSGLLGKIGVSTQTFRRGEHADMMTLFRPWTEPERAVVRAVVERYYETFLQRVAAGRKMGRDEVDRLARGRVWTGAQAHERRLVDALGGLDAALARAREKAGLGPDSPVTVPGAGGLFEFPESGPSLPAAEALSEWAPGTLPGVVSDRALEAVARGLGLSGSRPGAAAEALFGLLDGRPLALALDVPPVR